MPTAPSQRSGRRASPDGKPAARSKGVKRPLERNERALLRALLDAGPDGATRAELARRAGLTTQAVGYIVESEPWQRVLGSSSAPAAVGKRRPGRPAERVVLNPDVARVLAIDYGHHAFKVGLANLFAEWREGPVTPQGIDARERPLQALREAVRIGVEQAGRRGPLDDVAVVSVAIAAPVDEQDGTVRSNSGTDKWERIRFRERIREYLQRETPILLANDANVGALAERYWAARRSPSAAAEYANAVYVRWTAGIGAGLLIHGHMYAGSGGAAGEVGHTLVVKEEGDWRWQSDKKLKDRISCTRNCPYACLEAVARTDAIVVDVRHRLGARSEEVRSIDDVTAGAREGRPECQAALTMAARYMGQMLSGVADVLNPSSIIIGGDFKDHLSLVEDDLNDVIDRSAFGPVRKDLTLNSGRKTDAVIHGTVVRALEDEAVMTHLIDILAAGWRELELRAD